MLKFRGSAEGLSRFGVRRSLVVFHNVFRMNRCLALFIMKVYEGDLSPERGVRR